MHTTPPRRSSDCNPPNNRPASCQREGATGPIQPCARGREAGTGEGSANLSGDCGAKEAVLEIAEEMIKEKTRLEDPEGQIELGLDP